MTTEEHIFITEYFRHSSAYTAYCIAYKVQDESDFEGIMAAIHRLMDREDVGGLIRSVLGGIRYEVEQQIRQEQKTELLTIQRKRELLANIATGEAYAIQNYKGKDCNQCTQTVRPTISQMLRAIDLDSKLAGHYPVKQAAVDNRQFTVPPSLEKSPELQQTITKTQVLSPGDDLGEALHEQQKHQQITTKVLSPGEDLGEVPHEQQKTQQTATKVLSPGEIYHDVSTNFLSLPEFIPLQAGGRTAG